MSKAKRTQAEKKAVVEKICSELRGGANSVPSICKAHDDLPDQSTFYRYMDDSEFGEWARDLYTKSKAVQIMAKLEEILDISDDNSGDIIKTVRGDNKPNTANVHRSKLMVEARVLIAEKLFPKKYGALVRSHISGEDGGPIVVEDSSGQRIITLGVGKKNAGKKDSTA